MKATFDKLEIQKIIFETGDLDVLVMVNITQGNLSYNSQLIISHTDLNILINELQKSAQDDLDFSSMFDCEKMYNGDLLYTLDFEKTFDSAIALGSFSFDHSIRQIRA